MGTFRAAFALCLFLLILTAKWATFDRYGSAMPDWDQWDAEAMETYVPWFHRENFLQHLFHPHNEHRVILTKLHNLALLLLNGQWDARLQAVTNAALHAALGTALWLLGLRLLFSRSTPHTVNPLRLSRLAPLASSLLFLLTFALHGLPLAWQNVLGGFHSQQYWLLALSFAALVTLPFAPAFSARWWLGAVSGILALGSMASGFLAAVIVILLLALRLVRRETTLRATAPTLALCLALIALGLLTRHEVPWHAEMKAKSVHDVAFSLLHSLQWPWREHHWAAPLLWLPWLLLTAQLLRPTSRLSPQTSYLTPQTAHLPQAACGMGAWVLLQLAATAYARGAGAGYPASRYMDTLVFGAMANALCLVALIASSPRLPVRSLVSSLWSLVLLTVWLATLSLGIHRYLADIARWELADAKKYYLNAESNLRRFLATGERRHLEAKDVPYPDHHALADRLNLPSLRATIAVPLRSPLPLAPHPRTPDDAAFLANNATAFDVDIVNPPRAGLSPATPPLDYTITWGSFNQPQEPLLNRQPDIDRARTWTSAPLPPGRFAYLKFEIAGHLGPDSRKLHLQLRDAATDSLLASVHPTRVPGEQWRSAYVPAPRVPYIIVAADHSSTEWFAFSGPVEMARLSYLAWQATKHGLLLFWISAGLTVAFSAFALMTILRAKPPLAAA